jgi:hypothetical protein
VKLDQEGKQIESDKKNRSKSWHQFPDHIEDKHDLSSKGDVGSRSFHSVEEYDAMINKISSCRDHRSEFHDIKYNGSRINMELKVSEILPDKTHLTEDKNSAEKMQLPCLNKNCSLEEREIVKEINIHNEASEICTSEKENKRKAIGKRLESLRIPSNIENPAIASLREWLPARGIYSPGSYVTPKFGSYSSMNNANESSEDSVFSPELVSAFEQCMQNLEAEEKNILKQITEDGDEESDEGSNPEKEINHK